MKKITLHLYNNFKQIYHYILFIVLCSVYFTSPLIASKSIQTTQQSLTILSSKIELKSPLIKKNKALMFPIRDILKEFKGNLKYSRKNDLYTLKFKDKESNRHVRRK